MKGRIEMKGLGCLIDLIEQVRDSCNGMVTPSLTIWNRSDMSLTITDYRENVRYTYCTRYREPVECLGELTIKDPGLILGARHLVTLLERKGERTA